MAVKLVVFDMDDTLFLESSYVSSGFKAVERMLFKNYGHLGFYDRAWGLFTAGHRGDIFDVALVGLSASLPRDIVARCVDVYREHHPSIGLLPDSREFVDLCSASSVTGLVTDGPRSSQKAKAHSLGLYDLVDNVIVTDEHSGWAKPSLFAFEHLQALAGAEGKDCIYIADNPRKDFIAPRALGWATVRVRRPGSLHMGIVSGGDVDFEVANLDPASILRIELFSFVAKK